MNQKSSICECSRFVIFVVSGLITLSSTFPVIYVNAAKNFDAVSHVEIVESKTTPKNVNDALKRKKRGLVAG